MKFKDWLIEKPIRWIAPILATIFAAVCIVIGFYHAWQLGFIMTGITGAFALFFWLQRYELWKKRQ